jgi:hypothetical protein
MDASAMQFADVDADSPSLQWLECAWDKFKSAYVCVCNKDAKSKQS